MDAGESEPGDNGRQKGTKESQPYISLFFLGIPVLEDELNKMAQGSARLHKHCFLCAEAILNTPQELSKVGRRKL